MKALRKRCLASVCFTEKEVETHKQTRTKTKKRGHKANKQTPNSDSEPSNEQTESEDDSNEIEYSFLRKIDGKFILPGEKVAAGNIPNRCAKQQHELIAKGPCGLLESLAVTHAHKNDLTTFRDNVKCIEDWRGKKTENNLQEYLQLLRKENYDVPQKEKRNFDCKFVWRFQNGSWHVCS